MIGPGDASSTPSFRDWRCRWETGPKKFFKQEEKCVIKMKLREHESIHEAVRRFRRLVERSGLKREVRRREYYEKPSDAKRRVRLRAERRARRNRLLFGH